MRIDNKVNIINKIVTQLMRIKSRLFFDRKISVWYKHKRDFR